MVFRLSSQQPTDTQERMERRQLGLVTSEGEVQKGGEGGRRRRRRKSFEGKLASVKLLGRKRGIVQLEEKWARLSLVAAVYSETSCFLPIKVAGDCFSRILLVPLLLCSICLHSLLLLQCLLHVQFWSFKHLTVDSCTCIFLPSIFIHAVFLRTQLIATLLNKACTISILNVFILW